MSLVSRARAAVAARAAGPQHAGDPWATLPPRLPLSAWLVGLFGFLAVYLFMFTRVHVIADTRKCLIVLDDPLFHVIAHDARWLFVTVDVYTVITLASMAAIFLQAWLGDHRPVVRWGLGLAICGVFRACTILLVPLCRATRAVGTAALPAVPYLDLGFLKIPWRMFASNDLLFSGHICELVLLIRATKSWPRPARAVLWMYQILQIYGLLAGRGHYTVDIIIAFPVAIFADYAAHYIVSQLTKVSSK